ncbi:hypothetical protein [Aureimonas leprariae]|uniref:Uncharacterized protein n=1 Tax=Plantimonas leprariae TaxID=2615207 RepID=A0A7V7PPT1_9HYPH|nr:hypothetical protein [Aureimonas leprariae]KAB0679962.1 hypothetical protein F6X38_10335 [Aureimonas leprariae]
MPAASARLGDEADGGKTRQTDPADFPDSLLGVALGRGRRIDHRRDQNLAPYAGQDHDRRRGARYRGILRGTRREAVRKTENRCHIGAFVGLDVAFRDYPGATFPEA